MCRYHGFNNERSLVLHRIRSARMLLASFDRPKEFSLEKYDNDGRFGFGEGMRIQLTFRIQKTAGSHLLEYRLSEDQAATEVGDEYDISATVVDSAQLDWWLQGFGNQVRMIRKVPENQASGN